MSDDSCYECENHNHNDCVIRSGIKKRGKGKHQCHCWCLDESSKYENFFSPKEIKIDK